MLLTSFHCQLTIKLNFLFVWTDIDECQNGPVCQQNAECVNTAGSYRCDCKPGYRFTSTGRCTGECWQGCRHQGLLKALENISPLQKDGISGDELSFKSSFKIF